MAKQSSQPLGTSMLKPPWPPPWAIDLLEWNQRHRYTERRTFWPNLWDRGGRCLGVAFGLVGAGTYGNGMRTGRHF